VLGPALASAETHEDDRGLVLLFQAGNGSLLWAGRVDEAGQEELARAYPAAQADVAVLGGDGPIDAAWLTRLGTRFWLELPPRQRGLNQSTATVPAVAPCAVWSLPTTGAVTVHFNVQPQPGMTLTPWVRVP
jgi:hypothetical protein